MQDLVIGVDHGFGNMKTKNKCFTSGLKRMVAKPPICKNTLYYSGQWYVVGGERLMIKDTKVGDEDYYILTLATIAEEFKFRGIQEANVYLGVGLPLTRVGAEKGNFSRYLSKNSEINYVFEDEYLSK